jgi:cysteine-rich repeat protein
LTPDTVLYENGHTTEDDGMRALLIAVVGLVVAGVAQAAVCGDPPNEDHCVINNGSAPPTPDNVIGDGTYSNNAVWVRDVGCPPGWPAVSPDASCPSPGASTAIELVGGGTAGYLLALDSSSITVSGGTTSYILFAYDSASVTVNSGTVVDGIETHDSAILMITEGSTNGVEAWDSSSVTIMGGSANGVHAWGSSSITVMGGSTIGVDASDSATFTMTGGSTDTVQTTGAATFTISGGTVSGAFGTEGSSALTISGGQVGGPLFAIEPLSTITIIGTGFEVNGLPVSYGDLPMTGTLTGTLMSGDPIDVVFFGDGWDSPPCSDLGYGGCYGTITLSVRLPVCGDGFVDGTEQCDDGGTTPGDGCDASCQVESGWVCLGEPSVCTVCGDGVIEGLEQCDDGGTAPGDGCDASCQVEWGWVCAGEPSVCSTDCGDSMIAGTEQCDDGGTTPGDGCDASCQVESGWVCAGEPSVCTDVTCDSGICVINNGLTPRNPDNVIDDMRYLGNYVFVRNVGCPPDWPSGGAWDTCLLPGAPTNVVLTDGGIVSLLAVYDSSTVTMNGGRVDSLGLEAAGSGTLRVVGRNFEVDGVAVPYGNLTAQTGTLAGTLASGAAISNAFYQGGYTGSPCSVTYPCSGTITLIPPPLDTPSLSPWARLALMVGLLGAGLGVWRGRGAQGSPSRCTLNAVDGSQPSRRHDSPTLV